jgi:hypothetical protein
LKHKKIEELFLSAKFSLAENKIDGVNTLVSKDKYDFNILQNLGEKLRNFEVFRGPSKQISTQIF